MVRNLPAWENALLRVMQISGGVAIVIMMVQVTVNGVLRKLVGIQIPHTLELAQWWYLPIIASVGIIIAEIEREHFEVDAIFGMLPRAGRKAMSIFAHVLTLVLVACLAYFSGLEAMDAAEIGRQESVTGIPIWPVCFVVTFSFATYAVLLVVRLYRIIVRNESEQLVVVDQEEKVAQ